MTWIAASGCDCSTATPRVVYRRFVEANDPAPMSNPLDQATDGWLLGSPTFVERYQDRGQALRNSELAECRGDCHHPAVPPIPNSEVPDSGWLLAAVAAEFGVTLEQLLVRGQHRNHARLAALWLFREQLYETLGQLGVRFGGLQPSTVSEALRQATRLIADNEEFRQAIERA